MLAPLGVGPHRLLEDHPVFTSRDIDEARQLVGRLFCAHGLEQTRSAEQLDCHMHQVGLGALSLNYLCYGAEVEITPGCLRDFYLIQIPIAGEAVIRYGSQETRSNPSEAVVLSPHQPVAMRWHGDCAQVMLYIPRTLLEQRMAETLGGTCGPLDFQLGLAQNEGPTAGWCHTVVDLARNIDHYGTSWLRHGAAAASLQDFLLHGLISQQPHNQGERLRAALAPALPRHVQRAQEFIRAHAEQALTVADIARAACVSVRALEEGFRRHLDTTPNAWLREVRLVQVREHLRTAADGGACVSLHDIAHRYGFFHLGRFAAYYKARFGEAPSATLRGR